VTKFGLNIFRKVPEPAQDGLPASLNFAYGQIQVQPCMINKQPFVIYPKGLKDKSPALYHKLSQYYTEKGYSLKEDQRDHSKQVPRHKERRRWAPVVLFTASLLFEGSVNAEITQQSQTTDANHSRQIVLRIVPKQSAHLQLEEQLNNLNSNTIGKETTLKSATAESLFSILNAHYVRQKSDPDYVVNDLRQIANYYSSFPEVVALLNPLRNKNWQMTYDANNWDTIASGSTLEVDKAVIHFNTRAAAQLLLNRKCDDNPVCIASPADALLHELLHTYSMFIDTADFIAQGGMNSVMYPFKHEYAIIDAERKLYASMSIRDDIKRPQRTEHTGRTVIAHCPICIK
jgi:hypothetical protein